MIHIKNIVITLLFSILLISCSTNDNNTNNNNNNTGSTNVTIQKEFDNKLVYNIDDSIPIEDYKNHCIVNWWTFNECWSVCWPDAETCIEMCTYTCEFENWRNNNSWENTNTWDIFSYSWNNETDISLEVTSWFTISTFADWLSWARDIVWPDWMWNYLLSRTDEWIITMLTVWENWELDNKLDILTWLNNPHGLALNIWDRMTLFFAEEDSIKSVPLYTDASPRTLVELPEWDRHYTRSLLFGSDWKLYISIGSTCDVCYEENDMHGTIYRMNPDWSEFEEYATWLRNAVFMDLNPITWNIWATEMWRDMLWDNTPPDEINIISEWNDYWWPICYWKNVHDTNFAPDLENACEWKTASHINLQAHSAPLWLSFIPEEWWPNDFGNDLLVAYHGSWNRSIPTWYKLMYFNLDDNGNEINRQDFIRWWLWENWKAIWRPVDILTLPWWIAFLTDDMRWVVYKITLNNWWNNSSWNNNNQSNEEKISIEKNFWDNEVGINWNIIVNRENNEIVITWEATWDWYFEWQFNVELLDNNWNSISESQVMAEWEWMSEDYVPFNSTINYEDLNTTGIQVVFHKANPSWLPANDFSKTININLE